MNIAEDWVEDHQAISGFAFATFGAALLPAIDGIKGLQSLMRRKSIIESVFEDEAEVHIVASHLMRTSYDILGTSQAMILPQNAPLLPSHTAMSIGVLNNYARLRYGDAKPIALHFDTDPWGAQEHSFISVGGPFTNRIAKEIFDAGLVQGLSLSTQPLAFVDEQDRYEAARASNDDDAAVTRDYGALIFMKNPYDASKYCLLVFGLWPQGALATMTATLNPDRPLRVLQNAIRKRRSVLAIVEVKVRGLVFENVAVVKTRPLV